MSDRRIDGFFYGLFMDAEILRNSGVVPANPRRGYVDGYELHIGERATLVPSVGARSYGMLFALTHEELRRLYSGRGLEQYRPEAILVEAIGGETVPALCYNLLEAPDTAELNAEYAAQLQAVLTRLGFPQAYVASIR